MQPYNSQSQYPQPYPAPYVVVVPPTHGLAVASLVFGILGWTLLPVLGAVIAVITGHVAIAEIRRGGSRGEGLAMAGLVLGWLQVLPCLLLVVVAVIFGIALLSGVR
jgi:Domain of unknown function (DUF4190)